MQLILPSCSSNSAWILVNKASSFLCWVSAYFAASFSSSLSLRNMYSPDEVFSTHCHHASNRKTDRHGGVIPMNCLKGTTEGVSGPRHTWTGYALWITTSTQAVFPPSLKSDDKGTGKGLGSAQNPSLASQHAGRVLLAEIWTNEGTHPFTSEVDTLISREFHSYRTALKILT